MTVTIAYTPSRQNDFHSWQKNASLCLYNDGSHNSFAVQSDSIYASSPTIEYTIPTVTIIGYSPSTSVRTRWRSGPIPAGAYANGVCSKIGPILAASPSRLARQLISRQYGILAGFSAPGQHIPSKEARKPEHQSALASYSPGCLPTTSLSEAH